MVILKGRIKLSLFAVIIVIYTLYVQEVEGFACNKPQLEIAVSPVKKFMQIYWNTETEYPEAWIGLYSQYPNMNHPDQHLLHESAVTERSGWVTTSVVFKKKRLAHEKSTNLGFYAVFWAKSDGKDQAIVLTPYESYPQWMKHFWNILKDQPINKIFIPGTHDTSSYEGLQVTTVKNKPNEGEKSFLEKAKDWMGSVSQNIQRISTIRELTITQDQNIQEQLLMGIRYLDMRILKAEDGNYYTSHSIYIMERLDKVIEQVVEFVERTEREIVIFDIHDIVTGISTDEERLKLIMFLKAKMQVGNKRLWVPPFAGNTWSSSLEKIYNTGGKIIVAGERESYDAENNHDLYWPPVHQYWGNKQNLDDLYSYFAGVFETREFHDSTLTAAMAELTGNADTITDNYEDGLNDQAEKNAPAIHSWFLQPEFGKYTNVLAVDYFRAMGVVRLAFLWNERTASAAGERRQCDAQESVNDKYYQHIFVP